MGRVRPDKDRRARRPRRGGGASRRPHEAPAPSKSRGLLRKFCLAVVAAAFLALLGMNGQRLAEKLRGQRIEVVRLEGSLHYVSRAEIERALTRFRQQSMVSIDLAQVKRLLEGHPWVREANVRREWPDTLLIEVAEQVPIARWGERDLLNQNGEVFTPRRLGEMASLPALRGPRGSERDVMSEFQKITELLYPLGLRLASLDLNARGAWSFQLENGVTVKVGRNHVTEKMRRFAAFLPSLERMVGIEAVDLRYQNGIAVSRREDAREPALVTKLTAAGNADDKVKAGL